VQRAETPARGNFAFVSALNRRVEDKESSMLSIILIVVLLLLLVGALPTWPYSSGWGYGPGGGVGLLLVIVVVLALLGHI
jgi:drug/metabolite transporter (DMT)-like permease